MEKLDVGRLFVQRLRLTPNAPRFQRGLKVFEITYPFRWTRTARILRLFGRGIVIGWWRDNMDDPDDPQTESKQLMRAMSVVQGDAEFQAASREAYVIQEARRLVGESDLYDPEHGYMTGQNDGPDENLGQVAEVVRTVAAEELTEDERAECER